MPDWAFVHVSKAGGTSIRNALGGYGAARVPGDNHHAAAFILRDRVGAEEWARLFSFAFVRNPWDRMVSMFCYKHPGQRMSISAFHRWLLSDCPFAHKPQLYTIAEPEEAPPRGRADTVRYGDTLVDFVGRYETLTEDFAMVCGLAGITPRKLGHANRASGRLRYQNYYTDETRELVAERFGPEVERFGFSYVEVG